MPVGRPQPDNRSPSNDGVLKGLMNFKNAVIAAMELGFIQCV